MARVTACPKHTPAFAAPTTQPAESEEAMIIKPEFLLLCSIPSADSDLQVQQASPSWLHKLRKHDKPADGQLQTASRLLVAALSTRGKATVEDIRKPALCPAKTARVKPLHVDQHILTRSAPTIHTIV